MKDYKAVFEECGIRIPEIMLPSKAVPFEKWAVIACDQFTSQKEYWEKAADLTSDSPSTLNMIYPECYLEEADPEARISNINSTMERYMNDGSLSDPVPGFILVNRETPRMPDRWGLVAAIDLEHYDFSAGSESLIRPTEGTILQRIPPRVRIRENAGLELPHIMVLIDDPARSVIEPLAEAASAGRLEKVYDFDLMMNSGHISGYRIRSDNELSSMAAALQALGDKTALRNRYGTDTSLLFAVGDGNHSLATAKTIWQNYKEAHSDDPDIMTHPSRWALVEIVNIYSEGLEFEAIHRVVFNINPEEFLSGMEAGGDFTVRSTSTLEEALSMMESAGDRQVSAFRHKEGYGVMEALNPASSVTAGTVQAYIDRFLENNSGSSVDYIHGSDVTGELGSRSGNIGIFLPAIPKNSFFRTVVKDGAFPRKTFSMGEASEKRFYIECRRIK